MGEPASDGVGDVVTVAIFLAVPFLVLVPLRLWLRHRNGSPGCGSRSPKRGGRAMTTREPFPEGHGMSPGSAVCLCGKFIPNCGAMVAWGRRRNDQLAAALAPPSPVPASAEPDEVRIPRDPALRERLANFAGLTDDERLAIDRWCYEEEMKRQRGVVLGDGTLAPPSVAAPEAPSAPCTGAANCTVTTHVHGCYADRGNCDNPDDHRLAPPSTPAPGAERQEQP